MRESPKDCVNQLFGRLAGRCHEQSLLDRRGALAGSVLDRRVRGLPEGGVMASTPSGTVADARSSQKRLPSCATPLAYPLFDRGRVGAGAIGWKGGIP